MKESDGLYHLNASVKGEWKEKRMRGCVPQSHEAVIIMKMRNTESSPFIQVPVIKCIELVRKPCLMRL